MPFASLRKKKNPDRISVAMNTIPSGLAEVKRTGALQAGKNRDYQNEFGRSRSFSERTDSCPFAFSYDDVVETYQLYNECDTAEVETYHLEWLLRC